MSLSEVLLSSLSSGNVFVGSWRIGCPAVLSFSASFSSLISLNNLRTPLGLGNKPATRSKSLENNFEIHPPHNEKLPQPIARRRTDFSSLFFGNRGKHNHRTSSSDPRPRIVQTRFQENPESNMSPRPLK